MNKEKSYKVKAKLTSKKQLSQLLREHKYFTFDSEGKCFTRYYGKCLGKVYNLSKELQISINDSFKYFEYPRFLYVFEDSKQAREFIKINMLKFENEDDESLEILYSLFGAIATTGTLLEFDAQLLRLFGLYHGKLTTIVSIRWRSLNQRINTFNLEVKKFIDNNSH